MSSKLKFATVFLCLISTIFSLNGQNTSEILIYDFKTNTYDTLSSFKYDTSIKRGHTKHYCNEKTISDLSQNVPTSNLIDDTRFTNLVPLAEMTEKLTFPYTTSVKIVLPHRGDKHQASGVMVGDKYVLTAGHSTLRKYTNEALFDQIDVVASYDFELTTGKELRSRVAKIYFVKDWRIGEGEDLVLLELEEPIGMESGWMSIGFEQDQSRLEGDLFHKMSYPAYNTPYNDKPYTGDDLHISYGVVDYVSEEFIGVQNHLVGLGGESGSPIFKTNNKDEFVTYGVLTFLGNYNHTRIKPSIFHSFDMIINDIGLNTPEKHVDLEKFVLYTVADKEVMLNWDLTDKTMFTAYEVERSYDGENFDFLSSVDADNMSEEYGYTYMDKKPLKGTVYYRLTGIDKEEESNFLDLKSVKIGKASIFDVSVYPNPTTDFININSNKELEGDVDLLIFTADGRRIHDQKLKATNTITTQNYEKGVYHIILGNQEVKESFSFIVQ